MEYSSGFEGYEFTISVFLPVNLKSRPDCKKYIFRQTGQVKPEI
jgi:hypothetical protein